MSFVLRPLSQQQLAAGSRQQAQQPPIPHRQQVACRAASNSGWGTSVLDRPPVQEELHEQQPAELVVEHASAYDVLQEPSSDLEWEREFSDYASATELIDNLEALQEELNSNVSVMDSLWFAPSPPATAAPAVAPNSEDAERRRAARKASREARKKAQAQAQAVQEQQLAVQVATAATSTTPSVPEPLQAPQAPIPAPSGDDLSADLQSLDDLRQQLSQMWEEEPFGRQTTPSPATSPPPGRVAAPLPKQQASTLSPSLVLSPKKESTTFATAAQRLSPSVGPSLSLPSTSPTPSAARARHQRRADRYSPRPRVAAVAAEPATSKGSATGRVMTAPDSTAQFMKAASSVALLQGNEQKELATVVKDYLLLMRIKSELKNILKREPQLDEWAKAAKMELKAFTARLEAGQAAKSVMVKSNYRLVVNIVNKYRGRGMEIHDLIAEGMHGLLRGVEKFDADKGFRFSTYAHWWIRQSVSRAISYQTRAVRVPYHMQELLVKLRTAKTKFQEQHNRPPTDEEMAVELKVPVTRITQALTASIAPKSLDAQLSEGDDGGGDLKDQLADERSTPEELFEEEQMQESVMLVLQELDEREAGIIRMRLGIDGSEVYTLEDIGRAFNVTRERVRQVEAKAMHKLQELAGGGSLGVGEYSVPGLNDKNGMVARASRGTHKS
uniref:RNA polymerase sigma-70 domain-containing protein n=1 Tax=Dunaliella tertiolecta TaxID=3047 RepID=A0A7S3QT50_DUNTE